MPGELEFEFGLGKGGAGGGPVHRDAMRILVVADLSGRAARGVLEPLAGRKPLAADVDTFDSLFARLEPALELDLLEQGTLAMSFRDLDDFHPDALYDSLDVFAELRSTRKRLQDPETFPQAAAELRHEAAKDLAPAEAADADQPGEENEATLERLLGRGPEDAPAARPREPRPGFDVGRFIADVVGSEIVPARDPQADQLVSSVDAATGDLMRAILHHPRFQALESAWRGLRFLIGNLETDEELTVRVLDASMDELAADLTAAGADLESSALYRILVEEPGGPDAMPWSMVALDFRFGPGDVRLLATLGALASVAGAPVLAGAGPDLDTSPHWEAVRQSPFASYVGLAAHRILLRLPYGKNLDETDRFEFEEMPGKSEHDSYLWGQAGMPLAFLLGKAYKTRGWSMEPGDERQIGDLPQHTYEVDGEKVMKACAEEFLSERAAEEVLARGTMPIMSYKHQPMVQVLRFQSIGGGPLAGPWA